MVRILTLLTIATFWVLSSCGKKNGKSDQVDFSVNPDQPVVITADYTKPNGTIVKAPWFEFKGSITNSSADSVTVIALSLKVTATKTDGTTTSQTVTVSPSDFNYTLICSATTSVPITFQDFGQFASGETADLRLTYRGVALPTDCAGLSPDITDVKVYIGGNPGTGVASYSYVVQLEPEGWFGTLSDPSDRFDKTVYFTTQ